MSSQAETEAHHETQAGDEPGTKLAVEGQSNASPVEAASQARTLHRRAAQAGGEGAGAVFAEATAGSGGGLPYRQEMEHSFGRDLSGVQAHVGRETEMGAIGAHAAAQGDKVAFASSSPSRETVAHEVTHVVQAQQSGGAGGVHLQAVLSATDHPAEREADSLAPKAAAGERVSVREAPAAPAAIHRDPKTKEKKAPVVQTPEQKIDAAIVKKNASAIDAAANTAPLRTYACEKLYSTRNVDMLVKLVARSEANWLTPSLTVTLTAHDSAGAHRLLKSDASRITATTIALALGRITDLLFLAGYDGQKGKWHAAVSEDAYTQLIAGAPSPINASTMYQGLWFIFGDGTARTAAATSATYDHLFRSRILQPGDTSVTWPGGTSNGGAGEVWEWRTLYQPVAPDAPTMTRFLLAIRTLPQGQVNAANVAFVNTSQQQYQQTAPPPAGPWTNQGAATVLTTSYYLNTCNTVVMLSSATGGMVNDTDVAQTPDKKGSSVGGAGRGKPKMTYFQNHARHEVGHAVGNRQFTGMAQSGDVWARGYGGWENKDESAFKAAYCRATGNVKLDFLALGGAKEETVAALDVRDWLVGLILTGAEAGGNALTLQPGTVDEKLAVIKRKLGGQELFKYFEAVYKYSGNSAAAIKDNGYCYPGFTPSGDPHIYASRNSVPGFVKYSKAAYSALLGSHGWYSLASDKEMFAEIYTNKYAGGKVPKSVNSKDPKEFFKELEASNDSQIVPTNVPPAPGAQAPSGDGAAPPVVATQSSVPKPPAGGEPPHLAQGGG